MREEILEILVEERSMEQFLKEFLPRILPEGFVIGQNCIIKPHNGKSDLQNKIPNTVRAYRNYPWPVRLLVIQDQDSSDCIQLKQQLTQLIRANNPHIPFLVRIACRELENWYLGDLTAVEQVYPRSNASRYAHRAKFRNPDRLTGSEEMRALSAEFTKTDCARRMGTIIDVQTNRSVSFGHLVTGLQRLV
jgi:hypothetical protein